MTLLSLLLALAAFAAFGLSTDAHHRRWFGGKITSSGKGVLRGGAWLGLAGALAAAVSARGWAFGLVAWAGLVMLAAAIVFLLLNFLSPRPEKFR